MIIEFPTHRRASATREISNFADLATTDGTIEERAEELMPVAFNMLLLFPPEAIAEMLAYAAARLERYGFKMLGA
jgi:hypothetical protein